MRQLIPALVLLSFITTSCQDDEEVATQEKTYDLHGYVQKGPFINGTAITVAELDQTLVATGKNFTTQIIDNKGSFSLKGVALQSDFVQLIAEGFYFDEVRGEKSSAQLTLFALADVSDVSSVNVNLLSHLEKDRVIYLMQEEELSFTTAKQQAQQEILTIFGIEKADIAASESLDISQDGEDNAILLAISAILQGNNTVAELSELLADIVTDIREDGVLDSESIRKMILLNSHNLSPVTIKENLEQRYEEMGDIIAVPNFQPHIDNILSSDSNPFQRKEDFPALNPDAGFVINSMLYVITTEGNFYEYNPRLNIWREKAKFPGKGRNSFSSFVLNGEGYVGMGYALDEGAQSDFWKYSPKSDSWEYTTDFPSTPRITRTTFVVNEKAYIGLGNIGVNTEPGEQDIWEFDPALNNWTKKADFPGQGRNVAKTFLFNGRVFIVAGYAGSLPLKDIWMYNPTNDNWERKNDAPQAPEYKDVSFVIGNYGYVCGLYGSLLQYSFLKDRWAIVDDYDMSEAIIGFTLDNKGYIVFSGGELYELYLP